MVAELAVNRRREHEDALYSATNADQVPDEVAAD